MKETPDTASSQVNALQEWDQRTAAEMFWLSALSLLCLSALLHLHEKDEFRWIMIVSGIGFLSIYPACWIDSYLGGRRGSRQGWVRLFSCLLPPLRLGASDHATGRKIWLPGLGWQQTGRELETRLDRISSIPMIAMALLVLPLIGVEYFWADRIENDPLFSGLLNGAAGLIWFAFAGEFILRLSIAEKKWNYVLSHWIDLAIVLLPLFTFLQAIRLGRLLRLQQLTKTARLYRLRGVALRAWRALLLLEAVRRLVYGPPERHLVKLRDQIESKERELAELRNEAIRLERMVSSPTGDVELLNNRAA